MALQAMTLRWRVSLRGWVALSDTWLHATGYTTPPPTPLPPYKTTRQSTHHKPGTPYLPCFPLWKGPLIHDSSPRRRSLRARLSMHCISCPLGTCTWVWAPAIAASTTSSDTMASGPVVVRSGVVGSCERCSG